MTISEQMAAARAYIEAGKYDDARRVLKKVDHPKAKEWLEKLNEKHPPKRAANWKVAVLVAGIIVIVAFGVWLTIDTNARNARFLAGSACRERAMTAAPPADQIETFIDTCMAEKGYE